MEKPLTGIKKRQQIDSARKTLFIWVVVAAAAVVICGVLANFMIQQMFFNNKIISAKQKTDATLVKNISNYEGLRTAVNKQIGNTTLAGLRADSNDTSLQVIIDALPTEDDRAALGASLQQKVLAGTGVTIQSLAVAGNELGSGSAEAFASTPQEISLAMSISGSYDQIQAAFRALERSIRPFSVESVKLEGSGADIRAQISLKTYYLPSKTVHLGEESIKP